MGTNGEAIYGTIANPFPASFAWGKSTRKVDAEGNTTLYLHVSQWPENGELTVAKLASLPKEVSVLGLPDAHPTAQIQKDDLVIKGLPTEAQNEYSTTIRLSFDGEIQINETFIYPNEKNILTLLPDDAKVEGLIVEGDANMRNIGSWAADKTIGAVEGKQAQWNIYVPLTGTYNVSAWLGAQLGGQFNIAIDGTPAADLDYPDGTAYHVAELGTINLTEGKHVLTLTRTSTTAEWNYVNLLNLVFTPQPGIGTGISAPDTLPLQIFAGNGNVRLSGLKAGEIVSIYDVLGHCLLKTSATATTEQYAITGSGVLIVRVETEGRNIQTAKIIL